MSNQPQHQDWGPQPQNAQAESGFDFIGMLQRRFWIIILCILLATGGGVFWFWKSAVVYSSVARAHIYFRNPNVSIIGNEGFAATNTIRSHDELIRSEDVLNNAAIELLNIIQKETQRENAALEDAKNQSATNPDAGEVAGVQADENEQAEDASPRSLADDLNERKPFAYLRDKSARQIADHLMSALRVVRDRDDPHIYSMIYSGPSQRDCHIVLEVVIGQYTKHLTNKYRNEGEKVLEHIRSAQRTIGKELQDKQDKLTRWRKVDRVTELEEFSEGFHYSANGSKTNRYRAESQSLYEEIQKLMKQRDQLADDQSWIKEAIANNMSKQEILTHIDKFAEWLQIEQRKNLSTTPKSQPVFPIPFEEPEPPNEMLQAQFDVSLKKAEIQDLVDRGFGENYPGRRKMDADLKLLEERLRILETNHKNQIAKAKAAYDEMKRQAEESARNKQPNELPKILNEIDMIGLHKAYLDQKLVRLNHDLGQLVNQRQLKETKAKMVDMLLREEKELKDEIARQDSLNTTILQKIREVDIEKDNGGYALDILNSPSYARQTEPSMVKIFAITTFIGLMVGTGLGYLVEIADKTFRSPTEIAQQLGMQVMGHVPILSTKKVDSKSSKLNESLIAFHLPKSQQAEAFRAIRTNLFFNAQGKDSQIIQVTSPTPGDGKSTLAANLAISLAQSGKRVLLVDADLRRPTVEYLFSTDTKVGFSSVLSGEVALTDALLDCEVEGLQLMPVGRKPANPSELLTSSKLFDLFETLREKFDFIVVDSPPMLAVTDPCAVAARADGVILAMRIKKNVKLSAGRAKEVLDSVGANIMGIVVNGAGMVQGNYSNSAAYGYGYGYGSGYAGNYYSYGYDDGESSYYYDDEYKPTTTRR